MVSTDGAIVDHNIPSPQSYGIPLKIMRRGTHEAVNILNRTFFTSNLAFPPRSASAAVLVCLATGFAAGASVMSTSAISRQSVGGCPIGLQQLLTGQTCEVRSVWSTYRVGKVSLQSKVGDRRRGTLRTRSKQMTWDKVGCHGHGVHVRYLSR